MICRKCRAEVPDGAFCLACGARQAKGPAPKTGKAAKRGNGLGSVYRYRNGWRAQITVRVVDRDGVISLRRKTKDGFQTKRDASEYLERLREEAERKKRPTLLDYYEMFEDAELPKLSANRQSGYKKARERLASVMLRPVDSLALVELQSVVNREATSYYTARAMRDLLSNLYQKAMADRVATVNLAAHLILPELQEEEPEPFSPAEVSALWQAWTDGDRFTGYILLMIYSGMMPGELLEARKDTVDLEACEIRGAGKKTKTRKQAAIVFPQFMRPVLEELLTVTTDNGRSRNEKLVCMNKDRWYAEYYAALERAGTRRLPPYSCRHTTGTAAAQKNLSAPIIQQIMRHAKITTSQRYIHLDAAAAHSGVEMLDHAEAAGG